MTIAFHIWKGISHRDLGLSPISWASRRATLEVFLQSWQGNEETFDEDYIAWLETIKHLRPPEYPGTAPGELDQWMPTDLTEGEKVPPPVHKVDRELPSVAEMASNLASATKAHVKTGFKNVEEDVFKTRIDTCTSCEFFRTDNRCAKCGCFMKVKARWASAKCPIGKWSAP